MKQNVNESKLKHFSGLMVFFLISAILWLVVKLSDNYTETLRFKINLIEEPADYLIHNEDYSVEATVGTTGFKLLLYYFTPKKSREITVSLKDLKYKTLGKYSYSFNSAAIKESIADFFDINVNNISLSESEFAFTMYRLASKKVEVKVKTDLTFDHQYNFYGEPTVVPDSITIFGAFDAIKDIECVYTQTVTGKNIRNNIERYVGIQLEEGVYSDIEEVMVFIEVEKYTEAEVTIPINTLNIKNIILYPDNAKVKYIVAMKDYPSISTLSFNVEIDTTNFKTLERLPLKMALYPNNTSIIGIVPKEVEYLITK